MLPSLNSNNNPAVETPAFALSPLASALGFALAASAAAMGAQAQTSATQSEPRELSKLVAEDTEEEIKVDVPASPKFTQPLLDTPQTITVVTQQVLSQQGATTLMEALANTPGITLQLGENGNTSAGDTFSMRGSTSQTNIFLDGVRDLGAITRDTFNTQQVEIAKGAVGADYGRGATAGYINMVSKLPQVDDFISATASADTGTTVRTTADVNRQLGANSSLRFNAMWQDGDVVGRDFVEQNRWGVAPSLAFGLNTATRFYLYSQHVHADNVPDGGIPSIGLSGFYNATLAAAGIRPAAVDTENFYGRYDDYEKTKADMGTLRVEHDFSDTLKLVNSTRYGESDMERVLTGINALCFHPLNAQGACPTATGANSNTNLWSVSRSRQSVVQENKLLTNQTNLTFTFNTGFIEHDVASGLEFIKEEQYSPTYTGLGTLPNANLYAPNAHDNYTVAYARAATGAYTDGENETSAVYAFDTLKFSEQWLLTAGVRHERYETDYVSYNPTSTPATTALSKDGNLTSWKAGLVFKPVAFASIYAAVSTSQRPPGNDNFTLASTTSANANNTSLDPSESTNYEVGTKLDLLDARLALNLALYRTDTDNDLQLLDATTNTYVQYGTRRVQGAEFGMVGKLTDNWQITAGLAWSDNERISGTTTGNEANGASARWAPEFSGNLWTTYTVSKWGVGLGANYSSDQKRVVDPSTPLATQNVPEIPGYVVFNGMLGYVITDNIGLQLNVYNLTDKEYISSLNNSGARLRIGAPRYAKLTANFKF